MPDGRRGHSRQHGAAEAASQNPGRWAQAGLCGQGVSRVRQLLRANAGGTAAMNGPKSHLKGTLCPTSSTWPHCGQLRHSSSSSDSSSGDKRTSWPALVGRGRLPPHCAVQGAGSRTKLSTAAAATSRKLSGRVNRLDGDSQSHGSSFSAQSS